MEETQTVLEALKKKKKIDPSAGSAVTGGPFLRQLVL